MAGCPKCSIELPRVNAGKPSIVYPNGFRAFRDLRAGETIFLPDEWFHPARENLPPTYYKILPHHDGVTPGSLGDAPGNFPELDVAVAAVAKLAALDDAAFTQAVGDASSKVDAAVRGSLDATRAKAVTDATKWAWQRSRELASAIAANDRATITRARLEIQNALATALSAAAILARAHSAASSDLQAGVKAAAAALTPPSFRSGWWSAGKIAATTVLAVAAAGGIVLLATRSPNRRRYP